MKKQIFLAIFAVLTFCNSFAGGLLTNTNQSVSFLRNPARDASFGIDAVYFNPAGLAFLEKDGFFLSFNAQSAFQTRTLTTKFPYYALNGGSDTKTFKGEASAPFIPNLQLGYKTGDWTISANLGVVGGGGTLEFGTGLPSFEAQISALPAAVNTAMGAQIINAYSLESKLKGSSITYGVQLGATYSVSDNFAAYLGLRYNIVSNGYEGYLKNITLTGAATITASTPGLPAALAAGLADKNIDLKQSGSGIAPIIGLDYKWNSLNIGLKYEMKSSIELTNKTTENTSGVASFDDGFKTPYDIPALLTVGAQYEILSALTVSAGYHHYFDSDAKMLSDRQTLINGGTNEYLAGAEYKINEKILVSAGAQFTRSAVTDAYQSDLNYFLNSVSFGFGGAYNFTEKIRLNAAYFFTNYADWTTEYPTASISSTTFGRTNKTFGLSLDIFF